MLTRAENELLCRVGAGTPMGELMRQYWLPSAYGVDTTGVMSSGQINVTVENVNRSADVMIVLTESFGDSPNVQQRRWSETHDAGVAVGYEAINFKVVRVDGRRFVSCRVGPGQTEIVIK